MTSQTWTRNDMGAKRATILEQQRQLATQLSNAGATSHRTEKQGIPSAKSIKNSKDTSEDSALKDTLFGKFANVDTESMFTARSRFANEADAEEYATSRRAVTELERREAHKKEANLKKSTNGCDSTAIEKEWICSTCNRMTRVRPNLCFRAHHKVRLNRSIQTAATVTKKRLQMGEKSVEEGGLTLGKGLEWSRWHE
jgi:minichromosome maintenance protein 10